MCVYGSDYDSNVIIIKKNDIRCVCELRNLCASISFDMLTPAVDHLLRNLELLLYIPLQYDSPRLVYCQKEKQY